MATAEKLREVVRERSVTGARGKGTSLRVVGDEWVLDMAGKVDIVEMARQLVGVPVGSAVDVNRQNGDASLRASWPSLADRVLGPGGLISQQMPDYEPRQGQIEMARLVQRAMESGEPAIIEAPTGVGKSFAYLIPPLAAGKRVLVSTSNKALQGQLYHKDAPWLLEQLTDGGTVAMLQGKANYVCLEKALKDDDTYAIDVDGFVEWLNTTPTGVVEDFPVNLTPEQIGKINLDSSCTGKACPLYDQCFYFEEKRKMEVAQIVITNHALLALHLALPYARLLPETDLVVVDEAHQLVQMVRSMLGTEFKFDNLSRRLASIASEFDVDDTEAQMVLDSAFTQVRKRVERDMTTLELETWRGDTSGLHDAFLTLASAVYTESRTYSPHEAARRRSARRQIENMRSRLALLLVPTENDVRWVDLMDKGEFTGADTVQIKPVDVSWLIGSLAGVTKDGEGVFVASECAGCHKELESDPYIVGGLPYCGSCMAGMESYTETPEPTPLAAWLDANVGYIKVETSARPVVFTSATLGAPAFDHLMEEWGMPHAMTLTVDSPFDYDSNAALYTPAPGKGPTIDSEEWMDFLIDQLRSLTISSRGGAFLLFTSTKRMQEAADALTVTFQRAGMAVYQQGSLPKPEIIARFRENPNCVLFATRSFFEGVDVKGANLRLVTLDRLPFETPTPLVKAEDRVFMQRAMDRGERVDTWYTFNKLRVPRMVIDLRQVFGRLIRTQDDFGVFAVLDPRITSKSYGRRNGIGSLPRMALLRHTEQVRNFYIDRLGLTDEDE